MELGLALDGGNWVALSAATVLLWHLAISAGEGTLAIGEVIRANQTLTSSDGTFALGFFDSGNSTHHLFHLAVWYARIPGQTVVWVAYRNSSLTDPDGGGTTIDADGNLVVVDGKSTVVWSSGLDAPGRTNAVVEESGNLALKDGEGRMFGKASIFRRHFAPRDESPVELDDREDWSRGGAEVEERLDYRRGFGVSGVQWDDVVFEGRGHVSHCYLR